MNIKKEFYNKLPSAMIKINWNKNPIKMDVFLSFLTVPVLRSTKHLGSDTGWTLHKNEDVHLMVGGGIVNYIEYLNSLQFGRNLSNPYNNYVNPFYLWGILNDKGRKFFTEYYRDDISKTMNNVVNKIKRTQADLSALEAINKQMQAEVELLNTNETIATMPI